MNIQIKKILKSCFQSTKLVLGGAIEPSKLMSTYSVLLFAHGVFLVGRSELYLEVKQGDFDTLDLEKMPLYDWSYSNQTIHIQLTIKEFKKSDWLCDCDCLLLLVKVTLDIAGCPVHQNH